MPPMGLCLLCLGLKHLIFPQRDFPVTSDGLFTPTTDWHQGCPILLMFSVQNEGAWFPQSTSNQGITHLNIPCYPVFTFGGHLWSEHNLIINIFEDPTASKKLDTFILQREGKPINILFWFESFSSSYKLEITSRTMMHLSYSGAAVIPVLCIFLYPTLLIIPILTISQRILELLISCLRAIPLFTKW